MAPLSLFCGNVSVRDVPNQDPKPHVEEITPDKMSMKFPKGIVPYFVETASYDSIIVSRIQTAMDLIEASSCVIFKQLKFKPIEHMNGSWLHFINPVEVRECVHKPSFGYNREITVILGYECMMLNNIMHAVLHAIGFKDEVSHPHREQYIRIMWENIQPRYRDLFRVQREDEPYKTVEYDPMSIMHFHDRAFSINGGLTISPRVPGLLINPSDKLSQLDVMKLRLWFGQECNKRKVGALLEKCKTVFHNSPSLLAAAAATATDEYVSNESIKADKVNTYEDRYAYNEYDPNAAEVDAGGDYAKGGIEGVNGVVNGDYDDDGGNANNGSMDNDTDKGDGNDGDVNGGNGNPAGDGNNGGAGDKRGVNAAKNGVDHDKGGVDDGINEILDDGARRKV